MGIEFTLRDSPPKPIWRGKTSADNTIFPSKSNLAGKFHHQTAKKRPPHFEAAPVFLVLNRYAVDEAGDPWFGCAFEEVFCRTVEADLAVFKEEHAVRCFPREVKVVRHDDHGQLFGSEFLQDAQHFCLQFGIEGGSWFVEQDEIRLHGQGARDGYALLLPARQLVRIMIQFVSQADFGQQIFGSCRRFCFRKFQDCDRSFDDIFQYRQMRKEVEALEHHRRFFADGHHRFFQYFGAEIDLEIAVLQDAAFGHFQQVQGAEQGGLARTGWADMTVVSPVLNVNEMSLRA